jgi:O-antigen/teichoic acid export membrane protein
LFFANFALDIPFSLIILNGLIIFFSLTSPVVRGVLQGQKRFFDLGINIVIEGAVKFVVGILFLLVGWEIYGAFGAVIISMALPLLYGIFKQVKPSPNAAKQRVALFSVFKMDVLVIMTCITLFFMLDVFLARAVLSPVDAGYYSIASTIAKMAFIGTQPISRAMLSHVASSGRVQARHIFRRSAILLASLLAIGLIISFTFSDLLVFLFSGGGKGAAASILGIVFLAVSLISLANLFLFYKIALNSTARYLWLSAMLIVLLGFLLLAPSTLMGFAVAYLLATIIFLIGSILILRW